MNISEIMSSPAITVGPSTSVQEIAGLMREHQISGVPIVDDSGALMGAITELDLIARNAPLEEPRYIAILSGYIPTSLEKYRDYKERLRQALASTALELMDDDHEVVTVTPDTSTDEALRLMLDAENFMLPVIAGGKVVGVVSRTDVVRLIETLESQDNSPTE
jgi:CBS domain-containing protein